MHAVQGAERAADPTGISPFLGAWVNTEPDTRWICEFTLAQRNGVIMIAPIAVTEPRSWGEAPIDAFCFKPGESSFYAELGLSAFTAALAGYTNKGLIVIAAHLDFPGAPDRNHLCREFYIRKHQQPEQGARGARR